jgi:hypothetical protein
MFMTDGDVAPRRICIVERHIQVLTKKGWDDGQNWLVPRL